MNIKKILALLGIVLAIVVIGIVIVTRKKDVRDGVDEKVLAKIAQEVWDEKPNEKGQKLICISRKDADDSQIEEEFFRRHNYNIGDYEDDHSFEDKIVPMITQQVMEKYGDVDLENDSEMSKTINAEINVALNEAMDDFISKKRTVITDLNTATIEAFIKRNSIDNSLIQYKGSFTGTIIMYATDEQIIKYAKDEEVIDISIWNDVEEEVEDVNNNNETPQEDNTDTQKGNSNAQYIRTNGSVERDYPVVTLIHSVEELNAYYEANKENYDLERRVKKYESETIGFLDACDKYDEEYFKEQVLVLVALEEVSSSISYEVADIHVDDKSDEKKFTIRIKRICPEICAMDMEQWHIFVEFEKGVEIKEESQVELELVESSE